MKLLNKFLSIFGVCLLLIIWLVVKYIFGVEDRFLPSPLSVFSAIRELEPNIGIHFLYTSIRLWFGFTFGLSFGVFLGLLLFRSKIAYKLLHSTFQSLRSIPSTATIPFFLLWFGFSETGRFLIIIVGISFNLAISTFQILINISEKYEIFFKSINSNPKKHSLSFCLPYVLEKLLPTVRFSLSTAIALVVVSEMLGSQTGLGYLIQTARSTFSLNVIMLATVLFGVLNFLTDFTLIKIWKRIVFWQNAD